MRGIIIASVAVLLISTVSATARDDAVFINLSVLDALNTNNVAEPTAPLFPVIKPLPKKTVPIKSRPVAKKLIKKPVSKVNVEVKNIVKPQPVPVKKEKVNPEPIPQVESTDEVVVVDVEPITAKTVNEPDIKNIAPEVVSTPSQTKQPMPAPVESPVSSEQSASESLLINPQETQPSLTDGKIVFAEGESTLTDEHKAQIDAIINNFVDAANHKIAIYSYNLDNGVDSFRKKRQSLNRAVEVRSYLLQKGYKDFSIKVLNIEDDSDKTNSVELEELK